MKSYLLSREDLLASPARLDVCLSGPPSLTHTGGSLEDLSCVSSASDLPFPEDVALGVPANCGKDLLLACEPWVLVSVPLFLHSWKREGSSEPGKSPSATEASMCTPFLSSYFPCVFALEISYSLMNSSCFC